MPDTGAPWNIPYVEPSDLVRTYPAASEDLADAIAAGLSLAGGVKQVKSATQTAIVSISSTSYAVVTGLSVTITPDSDTSRFVLLASIAGFNSNLDHAHFIKFAGGNSDTFRGAAAGTRERAILGGRQGTGFAQPAFLGGYHLSFLDSPATASAITYQVVCRTQNSAQPVLFNRSNTDSDGTIHVRGASSLIVVEVMPA